MSPRRGLHRGFRPSDDEPLPGFLGFVEPGISVTIGFGLCAGLGEEFLSLRAIFRRWLATSKSLEHRLDIVDGRVTRDQTSSGFIPDDVHVNGL